MSPDTGENPKVTKPGLIEIFEDTDKPILTTGEIIDQVPVTRPAVNPKLKELVDEGKLGARKASNTWFYWLPGRVVETPTERIVGDEIVLDVDDRHREDLEELAEEEETTPEEVASELLADALKPDPFPYWDRARTVSFAVVVWFFVFTAARQYAPTPVETVIQWAGVLLLIGFLAVTFVMILQPFVDPVVDQAQEWLAERRGE